MSETDDLKGYIPKDTTQQTEFVKKCPNFDGRGLLIAILDTGIDVGFNGMQKTSIGLPKIVDCFDFTGAGNVDTSIVRESDNKNVIIGLSGRSLKIPSKWINPSGKWHLGLKSIYELCSEVATESIIKIRKKSIAKQNELILKQSKCKNDENHKSLVEYLKMTEDLSKDSLVADCIVWNNGEKWQACIDTSFKGNLKKIKVLKDFPENYEYGTFWNILNYCIKIHENGNLLQIFSAASEHGNYVSHVAAACFPNEPEMNGLAPGAQLISMTVLDNRNGNCVNCNAVLKSVSYIKGYTV
uniref:Peptidase S8/S53 domain-containing protein n=1 Tax=Panagrolaimus davidi TaxID=227884 RepID=A0A914Q9E7_9BILA